MSALSPLQPFTEGGRLAGARLCHFKTGSSDLLRGHKHWIANHFVTKMKQHPNAWIDLIGYTSRAGATDTNISLSSARLNAVEQNIKSLYPGIKVNMRTPDGEGDARSFNTPEKDNAGYWRAVLVRWYGVPIKIETPVYPPEVIPTPKARKYYAPKGCWCIIGVDSFGLPVKAGISVGVVDVTLLNDKGEKYIISGAGAGGGLGVDVAPTEWAKGAGKAIGWAVNGLKEIGLKAGDLQNVSSTVKSAGITGPSETAGGVFKRVSWAANLTIDEITSAGFFTVASGELQFVIAGAEMGMIFFSQPPIDPIATGVSYGILGKPWGFFTSAGLGTLKGALGISATVYKTTSVKKVE